jgi:hypothetical protein
MISPKRSRNEAVEPYEEEEDLCDRRVGRDDEEEIHGPAKNRIQREL